MGFKKQTNVNCCEEKNKIKRNNFALCRHKYFM